MKKLCSLIVLMTGLSLSACVDKNYDLSKVDTDDVTIGGDDSEFRIPLATVKVDLAKMAQGTINLEAIIAETKVWLPSPLPAGAEYVDIPKLRNNPAYLEQLLTQLFAQLSTDATKLNKLSDQIWNNPNYRNQLLQPLNLPINPSEVEFKTIFKKLIGTQDPQVTEKTAELASNYLKNQLTIDDITFEVEGFELDDSVIDLLSENLGKTGNSLHLYGNIKSILPVSVSFNGIKFDPTDIVFSEIRIEADATGKIDDAQVSREDLRKITEGLTILLPVELTRYYPDKGFDTDRKDQLIIELKLVKRGALSLNL